MDEHASSKTHAEQDNDSVSQSSASIAEHDQEPFETFKEKVSQLCTSVFGSSMFSIERMEGGAFNRITALTVDPHQSEQKAQSWLWTLSRSIRSSAISKKEEYILRSLREEEEFDSWGSPYDIRYLQLARQHFGTLIPAVFHSDATSDNILGRPYTIQERLSGVSLHDLWDDTLNMAQKEYGLRILVDLNRQLQAITKPTAGAVAPSSSEHAGNSQTNKFVVGFSGHAEGWTNPKTSLAEPQTTVQPLCEMATRWQEFEVHECNESLRELGQLKRIAESLHELGFLPDTDQFHFCHLDLYLRNILVEVVDDSSPKATGVLDWDADFAHFCPKFVAYRAPFWMWNEEGADEDDEMLATIEPTDLELLRLKRLFEELVSDEWKRYAFTPEYMLERRLFESLKGGMRGSDAVKEARDIVAEWQKIHYDVQIEEMDGGDYREVDSEGSEDSEVEQEVSQQSHTQGQGSGMTKDLETGVSGLNIRE
jgi:hypothetical protein